MINLVGFSFVFIFVMIFGLALLGVWVWSIVDCLRSERSVLDKLMWILVILLFNVLGSLVYFILRDRSMVSVKKGKLKRSSEDRVISGVCGGLAEYFKIDAVIVRLLWVVLTIFSFGTGVILYIIAAIIMPVKGQGAKKKSNNGGVIAICIVAAIVILVLVLALFAMYSVSRLEHVSFTGGTSVSERIVHDPAFDFVMTSANYRNLGGTGLKCYTSYDESCGDVKDPYGVTLDCRKVLCRFDSDEGFKTAEVLMKGGRAVAIDIGQAPEPLTFDDCNQMGYEVLYPDLKGGPMQCRTPDGLVNITSVEYICVDRCGDGVCQEIVCMGEGCPCKESKQSCGEDC